MSAAVQNYLFSPQYALIPRETKSAPAPAENTAVDSSLHDTVTISPEALAYHNQAGKEVKVAELPPQYDWVEIPPPVESQFGAWFGSAAVFANPRKELIVPKENYDAFAALEKYTAEHSKHTDINAWAGISKESATYQTISKIDIFSRAGVLSAYASAKSALENVDEKIGSILKANNITLSEKETLHFSINQDGKIVVGKGIEESKRKTVENLLNEDITLSRALLNTVSFRAAESGETHGISRAVLRQDVEMVLQREYGVSLADFEINPDFGGYYADDPMRPLPAIRAKDGDHTLIESIREEEFMLYQNIYNLLDEKNDAPFEKQFSYRNGITVEKGKSDEAALNKVPDTIGKWENLDYAVSVDSRGMMVSRKVSAQQKEIQRAWEKIISAAYRRSFSEISGTENVDTGYNNCGGFLNQPVLQQYMVDMQRLMLFNNAELKAEDVKDLQVTFGRVNGKTFTVAAANLENLPPENIS
ncbi:MAG: hypothetical protein LBH00_04305 [Planctomycetaceae bacterium]|jgi:hypothetical protein|nr:hypothetical protein [Planctomycetaceae bacterium]